MPTTKPHDVKGAPLYIPTFLFHLAFLSILLSGCSSLQLASSGAAVGPSATPSLVATATRAPTPNSTDTPLPTATRTPLPTVTLTPQPTQTLTPSILGSLAFDGDSAFDFLEDQMAFGPRWPGSPGHSAVREYIKERLSALGWRVKEQRFDYQGFEASNIIGIANTRADRVIIVGAHYDTRRVADQTPGAVEAGFPVPGAVDGASGVAVLLELARVLDRASIDRELWFVFFDVEDNGSGSIPGWEYIAGSSYMAEHLGADVEAMVLVDMVGDADQQLYFEGNSNPILQQEIWELAAELGYNSNFITEMRHTMIDDHLPFALKGIPAVDIIDFDYPYWHTVEDTIDKASPESLERVGHTLEAWLERHIE